MATYRILLALTGFSLTWGAAAQERLPLGTALDQLTAEMDQRCRLEAAALESRRSDFDGANFRMSQAAHDAICGCAAAKTQSVQNDGDNSGLSRQVTLAETQAFVLERIMAPCMGDLFRDMYSGSLCRDLFSEVMCTCMKPEVQQYTDAEAMELGASMSVYGQAEQTARRDGTEPPPRTPLMERMLASLQKCGGV